jgi:DNA-binding MarR family transcriptional regulator
VLLASTWWLTRVAHEQPSQRRLPDFAATDPMMTSQVLRALEARGLVARLPDPGDSRARRLRVTPAGADLAIRALALVQAIDAEFFATVDDQPTLLALLRALAG